MSNMKFGITIYLVPVLHGLVAGIKIVGSTKESCHFTIARNWILKINNSISEPVNLKISVGVGCMPLDPPRCFGSSKRLAMALSLFLWYHLKCAGLSESVLFQVY